MSPDPVWAAVLGERDRALRVARARCASRQDAEDCVQEAMLRVARMDRVDLERVGALVTTVVINLANDGHRSRVRGARAHGRLHGWRPEQSSVDERVCDHSEARWLWSRRHELSAQDRQVLELRTQGLSGTQAASALGITPKAAEASFTRARARLKGIWQAAGAAVGVLWWKGSRSPAGAGATVAAAAVATVAALTLVPGASQNAGSPSPVPPTQGRGEGPVTSQPSTAPAPAPSPAVVPQSQDPRPAATAVPTPAARPSAPAAPVPTAPEPAAPEPTAPTPTAPPPPAPEPETLPETVERCVQEGVTVSPPDVECNPR